MADRFAWDDADLVPEGKADKDKMTSRVMDKFLRSNAHRRVARPDAGAEKS